MLKLRNQPGTKDVIGTPPPGLNSPWSPAKETLMMRRMQGLEVLNPNPDPESDEKEEEEDDLEYLEDNRDSDPDPQGAESLALAPVPVQAPPPFDGADLSTPAGRQSREGK